MKRFYFLFAVFFSISFNSCTTDNYYSDYYLGNWQWIESAQHPRGDFQNPSTINAPRRLKITDTEFKIYENDLLISKKDYDHSVIELPRFQEERIFTFSSGPEMNYYIQNDILYLIEKCDDCYTHKYSRMK